MRYVRIATALSVCLVCLAAMSLGAEIMRFSAADSSIGPHEAAVFESLAKTPGLEYSARDDLLTVVAASGQKRGDGLEKALTQVIAVKPMGSGYWLSLARLWFRDKGSREKVLQAWSMSALTGPNEGNVLPWRGLFGLALWDRSPSNLKNQAIADLGAALPSLSAQQQAIAKVLIERKAKNVEQKIQSLLVGQGVSARELAGMGL